MLASGCLSGPTLLLDSNQVQDALACTSNVLHAVSSLCMAEQACQHHRLQARSLKVQAETAGMQVHTLLKGLEKIAASADIPMLVAGDFNSQPGSAAHSLLVNHSVDPHHLVGSWPMRMVWPADECRALQEVAIGCEDAEQVPHASSCFPDAATRIYG